MLCFHSLLQNETKTGLAVKMAADASVGHVLKSKIFNGNALTPKDEFDEVSTISVFDLIPAPRNPFGLQIRLVCDRKHMTSLARCPANQTWR